jgi:hypothetical protein
MFQVESGNYPSLKGGTRVGYVGDGSSAGHPRPIFKTVASRFLGGWVPSCPVASRVGILKQNAISWYSGIPGFEVRQNSKNFFSQLFF